MQELHSHKLINTVLVDDHSLFIDGLERLLVDSRHFSIHRKFNSGKSLLEYLVNETPDLLILDIEMRGLNGLDIAKRLSLSKHSLHIVFLSMHDNSVYVREAVQLGASGFLNKSMESSMLIESLLRIMAGEKVFPEVNSIATSNSPLSEREVMILKLIAKGLTTDEISVQLKISPLTVKSHRKNMIQKLKAKNSTELLVKAFERGVI